MQINKPVNRRQEAQTYVNRFRGGKLVPVGIVRVLGNESGMLNQSLVMELDPVPGRIITETVGEVHAVFVPLQACDAIRDPDADYAGLTEVVREKLLSGNPLFSLEEEGEISQRCGVEPRVIGGVPKVSEAVRLAHNAAVNHLRLRKYHKAVQVLHSNTAITPAVLGRTVLDYFGGVLDPDDNINGRVPFSIPEADLRVRGIGVLGTAPVPANTTQLVQTGGVVTTPAKALQSQTGSPPIGLAGEWNADLQKAIPAVYAEFEGLEAEGISLADFYRAETKDKLVRVIQQMVKDNPQYGEEMALRWAHGLSVDTGKTCFVVHEQRLTFGRSLVPATDTVGVQDDIQRSDLAVAARMTIPVPRTELGGFIITFASLKPDEVLANQPHPLLTEPVTADNFVADQLALDPVPVLMRDVDNTCDLGDETQVAFYTGYNHLKRSYVHYGFGRNLDTDTVEAKTAIWQLKIPLDGTNVLYPDELDHYPFADQLAEVCTYTFSYTLALNTPIVFGPSPVETLDVIAGEDLFEEVQE